MRRIFSMAGSFLVQLCRGGQTPTHPAEKEECPQYLGIVLVGSPCYVFLSRVDREVQTVNWEAGKEGAVETGHRNKAHKPWIRGKKTAQTVIREGLNREVQTVN